MVKVAQHGGAEFPPIVFGHGRLLVAARGHLALIRWASEGGTNAQLDKGHWTGERRWNQGGGGGGGRGGGGGGAGGLLNSKREGWS